MQLTGIGLKPSDLGIVVPNNDWRPQQLETIEQIINSKKRIIVVHAPTGSGKSVIAKALLTILGHRAVVLTKTKDLQLQYEQQGVTGLYGRDNYICNRFPLVSAANGICHLGQSCRLRQSGCDYYDQKRLALSSKSSVLNYSYFFLESNGPGEFSARDWIIADEGHSIPDELARAYTVKISHADCRKFTVPVPKVKDRVDINTWRNWARNIQSKILGMSKHATGDRARILQNIRNAVVFLSVLDETRASNWVCETDQFKTVIRPIWVNGLAQNYLWRHAGKFLIMSATINPVQVLEELGVDPEKAELIEIESYFPTSRHPIRYVPSGKFNHKSTEQELESVVANINRILDDNCGRGIIHTGNYSFANKLVANIAVRHKERIITHTSDNRAESIARFRTSTRSAEYDSTNKQPNVGRNGRVIISPSLTEGLDFPYEECEFQIIVRLPFPNRVDPVWSARFAQDKKKGEAAYTNSVISTIVQAVGRGMRAADDSCITYILDENFGWLYSQNLYKFPRHFRDALRTTSSV